jgi:hypothetical protein
LSKRERVGREPDLAQHREGNKQIPSRGLDDRQIKQTPTGLVEIEEMAGEKRGETGRERQAERDRENKREKEAQT